MRDRCRTLRAASGVNCASYMSISPQPRTIRLSTKTCGFIIMQKDIRECLKRAAECARLAERTDHTELKRYLTKLATSWTKLAAEVIEAELHNT